MKPTIWSKWISALFALTLLVCGGCGEKIDESQASSWISGRAIQLPNSSSAIVDILNRASVVSVGESEHGDRELSAAKVELVLALLRQGWVDVIAFEASVAGVAWASEKLDSLDARSIVDSALFQTGTGPDQGLMNLFDTLKAERKRGMNIDLIGFDIFFGAKTMLHRSKVLHAALSAIAPVIADTIYETDQRVYNLGPGEELDPELSDPEFNHAIRNYIRACRIMDSASNFYKRSTAYRLLQSAIAYCRYQMEISHGDWDRAQVIRDSVMAENLLQLIDVGKKRVLIWTHNYHARRANELTSQARTSLGSNLSSRLGRRYFAIGVYKSVPGSSSGDLEHLLAKVGMGTYILATEDAHSNDSSGWLRRTFSVHEEAGNSSLLGHVLNPGQVTFVPAEQYDALLFASPRAR